MNDVTSKKIGNDQDYIKFYKSSIDAYFERRAKLKPGTREHEDITNDLIFMVKAYVNFPEGVPKKGRTRFSYIRYPFDKSEETLAKFFREVSIKEKPTKLLWLGYCLSELPSIRAYYGEKKVSTDEKIFATVETWYRERFLFSGVNFENLVSFEYKGKKYQKYLDEIPHKMWRNKLSIPEDKKIIDYGKLEKPVDGKTHFVELKGNKILLSKEEYKQKVEISDAIELQVRTALKDPFCEARNYPRKRIDQLVKKYSEKIRQKPWYWMDGLNKESAKLSKGPVAYDCFIGQRP